MTMLMIPKREHFSHHAPRTRAARKIVSNNSCYGCSKVACKKRIPKSCALVGHMPKVALINKKLSKVSQPSVNLLKDNKIKILCCKNAPFMVCCYTETSMQKIATVFSRKTDYCLFERLHAKHQKVWL